MQNEEEHDLSRKMNEDAKDKIMDEKLGEIPIGINLPNKEEGMAPIYGMAATLPLRSVVSDLLKHYLDLYYKVKNE